LYAFNFEQQGDIVSDYFKLSSGLKPNWIENNTGGLILYKPFITNLLEIRRFKGHSLIFKDKSVKKGDGMA